jgi:Ca-activated chloride channel family protein
MRRSLFALAVLLAAAGTSSAAGLLIPTEKKLPPLALLDHKVNVTVDDQVAVTRIEQTFRNHTDRQLEATYLFPVPKGASVRKFSMWVDGKEVPGELVEADKARKIYTDIVRRTQDPGLLEYMGSNLLKLRVFPVPAKGDQKISLSYTSIAQNENGIVEYVYPMKAEGKAATTLDKFAITISLKSQHSITNVYSPTHAITVSRPSEKEATVGFEKGQAALDKDFQLFYTPGSKDIGLTALAHRPNAEQNGYFMLLASPRAELSKSQQVPRDMVFVMDTSGSMRGKRMEQARQALKYCLTNLTPGDRFAVINFATTVNKYTDSLQSASRENVDAAKVWVDRLEATGGTNINGALAAAMGMRTGDMARTFTVVFFTDGRPTIDETNVEKILQNAARQNSHNTRVFTFGVGDDVNTVLLDALADGSRAVSTYVRESEDIEAKVSGLYGKISNPVLANLRLSIGDGVTLNEVYPPQLPDLFHGSQLVVLGRYSGKGHAAITLTGTVGMDEKKFVYEVNFADKTGDDKAFVEDLWARRKVGYLLDQIRVNGEKKELVDEIVGLAKRYGITTPYTSYLMVPDGVVSGPVAAGRPAQGGAIAPGLPAATPLALQRGGGLGGGGFGGGLNVPTPTDAPLKVRELAQRFNYGRSDPAGEKRDAKDLGSFRAKLAEEQLKEAKKAAAREPAASTAAPRPASDSEATAKVVKALDDAVKQQETLDRARTYFARRQLDAVQNGQLGVNFAVQNNALRFQNRLTNTANRYVQNRNCIEVGGVWIDDGFDPKMPTLTVKAQSKAYFRILEKQPKMREVFALGNYILWVSPSGTALIIDRNDGQEEVADAAIDRLFVAAKASPPQKK